MYVCVCVCEQLSALLVMYYTITVLPGCYGNGFISFSITSTFLLHILIQITENNANNASSLPQTRWFPHLFPRVLSFLHCLFCSLFYNKHMEKCFQENNVLKVYVNPKGPFIPGALFPILLVDTTAL